MDNSIDLRLFYFFLFFCASEGPVSFLVQNMLDSSVTEDMDEGNERALVKNQVEKMIDGFKNLEGGVPSVEASNGEDSDFRVREYMEVIMLSLPRRMDDIKIKMDDQKADAGSFGD